MPGIVKNAISEINNIAQQRINQIIRQIGQEMEKGASQNSPRSHQGRLLNTF